MIGVFVVGVVCVIGIYIWFVCVLIWCIVIVCVIRGIFIDICSEVKSGYRVLCLIEYVMLKGWEWEYMNVFVFCRKLLKCVLFWIEIISVFFFYELKFGFYVRLLFLYINFWNL